jgi:hypothetical protein
MKEMQEKNINPRLSKPVVMEFEDQVNDDHLMKGADGALLVDLKTIDGKEYILHKVTKKCSLASMSLMYNVPIFTIKRANNMATDQVFSKVQLLIPVTETTKVVAQKPPSEDEKKKEKEE